MSRNTLVHGRIRYRRRRVSRLGIVLVGIALVGDGISLSAHARPHTRLISIKDGRQGNRDSIDVSLSATGRFVTFTSSANNLTWNAGGQGVYFKDMRTGRIERVDVRGNGRPGNSYSGGGDISSDGRLVVFSTPNQLVARDRDRESDIYLRNIERNDTRLLSHRPGGGHWTWEVLGPAISPEGRFVTYQTYRNARRADQTAFDVYVTNILTGRTELVSVSSREELNDASSYASDISARGRFVVFSSSSRTLSPQDRDDGFMDVFLRDRKRDVTRLISVNSREQNGAGQAWSADISRDGRYVLFDSGGSRLDEINHGLDDCFVRDRRLGRTSQVNIRKDGWRPRGHCNAWSMSADGRFVGFYTGSGERLIRGSYQIYFADWPNDVVKKVSVTPNGRFGNGKSLGGEVSANGARIGFHSEATNLVPDDQNRAGDVFMRSPMN